MSDLNIRNVSKELVRALKLSAIENGVTLREWCVTLLADNAEVAAQLEGGDGVQDISRVLEPEEPQEAPVERKARKVSVPKPRPVKNHDSLNAIFERGKKERERGEVFDLSRVE